MISCSTQQRYLPRPEFTTIFKKEKTLDKWGICLRAEQAITLFSQTLAQNAVGNHLPPYYLSVALAVPDLHVTLRSRCASGYNR